MLKTSLQNQIYLRFYKKRLSLAVAQHQMMKSGITKYCMNLSAFFKMDYSRLRENVAILGEKPFSCPPLLSDIWMAKSDTLAGEI